MPDLDTAEPKEIAQDECLGNKVEDGVVKERTPEESDLAHRSEELEERVNYGINRASEFCCRTGKKFGVFSAISIHKRDRLL
ncbi:hypothetical protein K7X08_012234 [Anisodus acutangulus]|uniref:Uncharacterized protein n=1 Tax=Anisodus acutangulus TaxID=402998 RepID=A0A9Q1QWW8_9SOLA|nr:hypothetical protein K7X08_012234 [Anisodus acutangulus]